MMPFLVAAGAVLAGYLLGSVPFGYIVARAKGVDIRSVGSGNVGASNVARAVGKGWGVLVFFLDAAKGAIPVLGFRLLFAARGAGFGLPYDGAGLWVVIGVAAAALVGHLFPVFLRFRGGKGGATTAGAMLALSPETVLVSLCVYAVVVFASRYASLATLSAVASWPLVLWAESAVFGTDNVRLLCASTVFVAVVFVAHHRNIGRLVRGTEQRFGGKR